VAAARLATAGAALSTLAPGARGALPSETEIRAAAYGRLS
jgi:sugar/nucleoside kinase (ribokinase family)